jgi:4-alpha-glucanotransferase
MQDVLGLGAESRMNTPGTTSGNWRWRLQQGQLTGPIKERLRLLTQATGRNRSPLDLPALRPLLQASRA